MRDVIETEWPDVAAKLLPPKDAPPSDAALDLPLPASEALASVLVHQRAVTPLPRSVHGRAHKGRAK
jgi:hypothetical protein